MRAAVQGGVLPKWLQGSKLTYAVDPFAFVLASLNANTYKSSTERTDYLYNLKNAGLQQGSQGLQIIEMTKRYAE
jgi:hypothetical protein